MNILKLLVNISLKKQIKRDFSSLNLDTQQGRNEGGQGPHYPRRWITMAHLFRKVHLLPKALRFEHEGAKLASCPERHITSLCPWHPSRLIKQIWVKKHAVGALDPRPSTVT